MTMPFKYTFAIFVLLVFPLITYAAIPGNAGWHDFNLEHDKLRRYFRVYVPDNLAIKPDVVILLHGGTQSMRKIFRSRAGGSQEWQTLANENGFLLLVPNGVNISSGDTQGNQQNWNDCRVAVEGNNSASTADDVGFINTLLNWATTHYAINTSRIYVTGASNGGMMSLRLLTELGDKFAAVAVFVASQPVLTDCAPPRTPVPLFLMNGTDDPLISWNGGQIRSKGPELLSAQATLDFWLKVNRADKTHVVTEALPDRYKKDDSVIFKSIYPATHTGQPLWFYEVRGGGHTMPSIKHDVPFMARLFVGPQNKDIEAVHEAWAFLKQFSLSDESRIKH